MRPHFSAFEAQNVSESFGVQNHYSYYLYNQELQRGLRGYDSADWDKSFLI